MGRKIKAKPQNGLLMTLLIEADANDIEIKKDFIKYLRPLINAKGWSLYDETLAGNEIKEVLKRRCQEADLIVVLVSSDFLTSPVHDIIVDEALVRHRMGKCVVVAAIARTCGWEHTELSEVHILPFSRETVAHVGQDNWNGLVSHGLRLIMESAEKDRDYISLEQEVRLLREMNKKLQDLAKKQSQENEK